MPSFLPAAANLKKKRRTKKKSANGCLCEVCLSQCAPQHSTTQHSMGCLSRLWCGSSSNSDNAPTRNKLGCIAGVYGEKEERRKKRSKENEGKRTTKKKERKTE